MPYNVIDSVWFDKIGIVKVQTKYNGIKYYIGKGRGLDESEDEQFIAKLGMPVSKIVLKSFFKEEDKDAV